MMKYLKLVKRAEGTPTCDKNTSSLLIDKTSTFTPTLLSSDELSSIVIALSLLDPSPFVFVRLLVRLLDAIEGETFVVLGLELDLHLFVLGLVACFHAKICRQMTCFCCANDNYKTDTYMYQTNHW